MLKHSNESRDPATGMNVYTARVDSDFIRRLIQGPNENQEKAYLYKILHDVYINNHSPYIGKIENTPVVGTFYLDGENLMFRYRPAAIPTTVRQVAALIRTNPADVYVALHRGPAATKAVDTASVTPSTPAKPDDHPLPMPPTAPPLELKDLFALSLAFDAVRKPFPWNNPIARQAVSII